MRIGIDTTFLVEVAIMEHPGHAAARKELDGCRLRNDSFVLAPQVMAEFIHVVTDGRRFERPLTMPQAMAKAREWWDGKEVDHAFPGPEAMALFWQWMLKFDLGRKRLLDTLLAATYRSHEVGTILSTNARDYAVFDCFDVRSPT